jgi:hypothetical protein
VALGIFLEFLGFLEYFSVALVIYLDISGFTFAQENISKENKKKKPSYSTWAEPEGSTQSPWPSRQFAPARETLPSPSAAATRAPPVILVRTEPVAPHPGRAAAPHPAPSWPTRQGLPWPI